MINVLYYDNVKAVKINTKVVKARRIWTKALLSGKYKQGINSLAVKKKGDVPVRKVTNKLTIKDNKFCCLGVACHVLKMDRACINNEYDVLTNKGMAKVGLHGATLSELTSFNDIHGTNFKEIAKKIDAVTDDMEAVINEIKDGMRKS